MVTAPDTVSTDHTGQELREKVAAAVEIVNRWYEAVADEAVSTEGRRGTAADRDAILAALHTQRGG